MQLILQRFCYGPGPHGTFGTIELPDDGAVLFTVERPWRNNRPRESCIPEGTYHCSPRRFFRGGYDAVLIEDVPGRSHILFHIANTADDVMGCIGVGSRLGCLNGRWAVLESKNAFDRFMYVVGGKTWRLDIWGPPPATPKHEE